MHRKLLRILVPGLLLLLLLGGATINADQEKAPKPEPSAQSTPATAAPPPGAPEEYLIGAGDVLQVSVWKEPDASVPRVVVRADGKIALPLVKEVYVQGLTPKEVEKIVTERLSKLIPAADVSVLVLGTNSKKIYLLGAIRNTGAMPYTYNLTVMQALSEAGGLNENAKRKKIYILRTENGKDTRIPFNYDAAIKGEQMQLNVRLIPGDTLVVPPVR